MEIKVKIEAVEIAEALKCLADAIAGKAKTAILENPSRSAPVQTPGLANQQYTVPIVQTPLAPNQLADSVPAQTVPLQTVPTAVASYTSEQLAVAAAPLMDAGRGEELRGLLAKYGIQAMTMLKPDQYGAFATDLRAMGAKI